MSLHKKVLVAANLNLAGVTLNITVMHIELQIGNYAGTADNRDLKSAATSGGFFRNLKSILKSKEHIWPLFYSFLDRNESGRFRTKRPQLEVLPIATGGNSGMMAAFYTLTIKHFWLAYRLIFLTFPYTFKLV